MKEDHDNVVDFSARQAKTSQQLVRSAKQDSHRLDEADAFLRKLQDTKRLSTTDQSTKVANLGRLILELDPKGAKAIAFSILEKNEQDKRKRYIRFPNENVGRQARHAASGGSFARIISNLIQKRAGKSLSPDQAKIETVRKALRGTSFLPPSPFQMPNASEYAEAAQFATDICKMFDKLAEESDLASFLALISKHPIFPSGAWYTWNSSLEMTADHEPNRFDQLHWITDEDELQESIPWWVPRCVAGHWYIPLTTKKVRVPEHEVTKIRNCIAEHWSEYDNPYYNLVEPFLNSESTSTSTIFHRLPIWLTALPQNDRLVPYLYVSVHRLGGFYPNQTFPFNGHPTLPCFVEHIGKQLSDDGVYFPDSDNDENNTLYVHCTKSDVLAIGTHVDGGLFLKDNLAYIDMPQELPEWLHDYPVKRLLALNGDSETAMHFALSARKFCGQKWGRGDESVFRPAFLDVVGSLSPGPSQDTIAAYLLRNFVSLNQSNIFGAIKHDAVAKHAAARSIMDGELAKFRQAFEQRMTRGDTSDAE